MNPSLAKALTRLYPRAWRVRYGTEFEALLADQNSSLLALADIIRASLCERLFPTQGGTMNQARFSFGAIVKRPSAFLPLAMSLTALTLVLSHIAFFGAGREADEGTTAHLWQILMAGQLPILTFFAIRWLPRAPRQGLCVLGLQAGAVLASIAPVLYFNL